MCVARLTAVVILSSAGAGLAKKHALQGPIDDFLYDSFLCVRPTGKPMHPLANEYATARLDGSVGHVERATPPCYDIARMTEFDCAACVASGLVLLSNDRSAGAGPASSRPG